MYLRGCKVHIHVQKYMVLGEEECVLFREVSLFQGCPYGGVPLYTPV